MSLLEGLIQIDPRYSHLFANFIDIESGQIPENLNFLTYNFDASPESAWLTFVKPEEAENLSFEKIKSDYGIISSQEDVARLSGEKSLFIKLHGSACETLHNNSRKHLLNFDRTPINPASIQLPSPHSISSSNPLNVLDSAARIYSTNLTDQEGYKSGIRFAWDINHTDKLIGKAEEILRHTDVLVVSGYTFPAFNLANDFKLLEAFLSNTTKRIVLQLPSDSITEVEERLEEMIKSLGAQCLIGKFTNCSSFHIPIEYFRAPRKMPPGSGSIISKG